MNYRKQINNRGLKISWLANKIGVSQPLLSLFLKGERTLKAEKELLLKQILR